MILRNCEPSSRKKALSMSNFLYWFLITSLTGGLCSILLIALQPILSKCDMKYTTRYDMWKFCLLLYLLPVSFVVNRIILLLRFAFSPIFLAYPSWVATSSQATQIQTPVPAAIENLPITKISQPFSWVSLILMIWSCGVILTLVVKTTAYLNVSRHLKTKGKIIQDAAPILVLEQCVQQLRLSKVPKLLQSTAVSVPMLLGVWHPIILLPDLRLSTEQLRYLFLHELSHAKHKDNLLNWIVTVTQSLHWFNPFVFIIVRQFPRFGELACDETAVSGLSGVQRYAYSNTILDTVSRSFERPISLLSSAGGEKRNLKERLIALKHTLRHQSVWVRGWTILMATLLMASVPFLLGSCRVKGSSDPSIQTSSQASPESSSSGLGSQSSANLGSSSTSSNTSSLTDNSKYDPQIINSVDSKWKEEFPDIDIINEYSCGSEDSSEIILFGSLKSNPKQGIAVLIGYPRHFAGKPLCVKRFLAPGTGGAIHVVDQQESKECFHTVVTSNGTYMTLNDTTGTFN